VKTAALGADVNGKRAASSTSSARDSARTTVTVARWHGPANDRLPGIATMVGSRSNVATARRSSDRPSPADDIATIARSVFTVGMWTAIVRVIAPVSAGH